MFDVVCSPYLPLPQFIRTSGLKPVGRLHLFSSDQSPEKDFLLYYGRNVVGRSSGCTVALTFPFISKQHAIIEIPPQSTAAVLRDCSSLNGTYLLRPLRRLEPQVGHQLRHQDMVIFADLRFQYHHLVTPPGHQGNLILEEIPRLRNMEGPQIWETSLDEYSEQAEEKISDTEELSASIKVPTSVTELTDVKPAGKLRLFSSVHAPKKDFILYTGLNIIGRRTDCTVSLPFPFISELHAVIEIPPETRSPILRDCGSLNGTHLLKPFRHLNRWVNQELKDKDLVIFSKLLCQYRSLGSPLYLGSPRALRSEETLGLPSTGGSQLQETLLAEDSQKEGAHGAHPSPPRTASYLQPGSAEKTEPLRSQDTENSNTDIQEQPMESDKETQVIEMGIPSITPERKSEQGSLKRKLFENKPEIPKKKRMSSVVHTDIPEGSTADTGKENIMKERDRKSCEEPKTPEKEMERQTPEKDIFESSTPVGEARSEVVEVKVVREIVQQETEGQMSEDYGQVVQSPGPAPKSNIDESKQQKSLSHYQKIRESKYQRDLRDKLILFLKNMHMKYKRSSGVRRVASKVPVPETSVSPQTSRMTGSNLPHSSSAPASQESPILEKEKGEKLPLVAKKSSLSPKKCGIGQPQKQAAIKEEDEKPVEIENVVKTPEEVAELAAQSKEETSERPGQSVEQPRLSEEEL
ncbi:uncharacterized protein LOC141498613 [Macrotis lagotis]|uniref:uncharacterized protein LOC141498613 n=1 Tax=Macrotis lagotis TaxID=92651 RepID=UPI003D69121A